MATTTAFKPTIYVIDKHGDLIPCVSRMYKDGQWRLCRVQCYQLQPLIAEPLITEPIDETIHDIDGLPIHIATQDNSNVQYAQLNS